MTLADNPGLVLMQLSEFSCAMLMQPITIVD